jgi:hypothetical protein
MSTFEKWFTALMILTIVGVTVWNTIYERSIYDTEPREEDDDIELIIPNHMYP